MKRHFSLLAILSVMLFAVFVMFPPGAKADAIVTGHITSATSWTTGVYTMNGSVTVDNGATLNIAHGVIVKFNAAASKLVVDGVLSAQGMSGDKIYFTSYQDDIGGDTNGDSTSSTPAGGDWSMIQFDTGASSTIVNAVIRYGGNSSNKTVYNTGAILTLDGVEVATGTTYGIYHASGTTNITSSNIHDFTYGIYAGGDTLTMSQTTVRDNVEGIFVPGGTATITDSNFLRNPYGVYVHGGTAIVHNSEIGGTRFRKIRGLGEWTAQYIARATLTLTGLRRTGSTSRPASRDLREPIKELNNFSYEGVRSNGKGFNRYFDDLLVEISNICCHSAGSRDCGDFPTIGLTRLKRKFF